jgi:hypothetical protein
MKIRITTEGALQRERKGTLKEQYCPYEVHGVSPGYMVHMPCGDWCPLFGEPVPCFADRKDSEGSLQLCNGRVLEYAEAEDLREEEEKA